MKTIYTIGHSTMQIDEFINILKFNKINCIVDVRSIPYSKFAPQFNEEVLSSILKSNEIFYIHMGKELGARREKQSLYVNNQVDFEKVAQDKDFLDGIERVKTGVERGYLIALMCSERNPLACHRCILIGHQLDKQDYNIINIEGKDKVTSQREVDDLLLEKFYPNRNQINLFETSKDKELLEKAYRKQNIEVGYVKED